MEDLIKDELHVEYRWPWVVLIEATYEEADQGLRLLERFGSFDPRVECLKERILDRVRMRYAYMLAPKFPKLPVSFILNEMDEWELDLVRELLKRHYTSVVGALLTAKMRRLRIRGIKPRKP